jgi:hypothetical protein
MYIDTDTGKWLLRRRKMLLEMRRGTETEIQDELDTGKELK